MSSRPEQMRMRLAEQMSSAVDAATVTSFLDECERLGHLAAVDVLVGELSDLSPKTTRAVLEATAELHARVGLEEIVEWLDVCVALTERSGATALKFIRESPRLLALADDHTARRQMLRQGVELAEQDANVALEFFRVAPELVRQLDQDQLRRLSDLVCELSERDYVLGVELFRESPRILESVPLADLRGWIELGMRLVSINQFGKTDYFATLEYLRSSPRLLAQVAEVDCRRLLVQLGAILAVHDPQLAVEVVAETPALLQRIEDSRWRARMLQRAVLVAEADGRSAQEYLRRCPEVVGWLGYDDRASAAFDEWFKSGMDVLSYSAEGARAYFALETQKAMSALLEAQSGVPLRRVARTVKLFVQALCGREIVIQELPESASAGHAGGRARVSRDGRILYLPPLVRRHSDRELNRRQFLVMAAHEAGHLEFGTYDLTMAALADLSETVVRRYGSPDPTIPPTLSALFARYPQPGLIRDLWMILEDARVEARLGASYPGLRADLEAVAKASVQTRSLSQGMSVREMIVDGLLIYSAGLWEVMMPEALRAPLAEAWALCAPVLEGDATAADAVRTADRVYVWMESALGTYRAPNDSTQSADDAERSLHEEPTAGPPATDKMEEVYRPIESFDFRGNMNPDHIGGSETGSESTEVTESGTDSPQPTARRSGRDAARVHAHSTEATPAMQGTESAPEGAADQLAAVPDMRRARWGPAEAAAGSDDKMFVYDEWDGLLRDYRTGWCRVVEQVQTGYGMDFVDEVLQRHGPAIRVLRRYFESIRPPALQLVHGMADGEELDLDAVVRFRTEVAAGVEPSDRLYLTRERRRRDVAVALLIDISGSTSRRLAGEGQRVIDIEKASLVLLCEALDAVGDQYAMYGFSGKGRRQVEVAVLKDFESRGRGETLAKIAALEPQFQNRDGAAIRHATRKLKMTGARHQLVMLLSDGKPLDDGYAEEYALEDTKMALREAMSQGVEPFCITVDPAAETYVRRMYGEVRYTVIDRVERLPERLPRVYHQLTR